MMKIIKNLIIILLNSFLVISCTHKVHLNVDNALFVDTNDYPYLGRLNFHELSKLNDADANTVESIIFGLDENFELNEIQNLYDQFIFILNNNKKLIVMKEFLKINVTMDVDLFDELEKSEIINFYLFPCDEGLKRNNRLGAIDLYYKKIKLSSFSAFSRLPKSDVYSYEVLFNSEIYKSRIKNKEACFIFQSHIYPAILKGKSSSKKVSIK